MSRFNQYIEEKCKKKKEKQKVNEMESLKLKTMMKSLEKEVKIIRKQMQMDGFLKEANKLILMMNKMIEMIEDTYR